jgi:anti-sigma-K factor RskA
MAEVGRRGELRLNTMPAATGRQLQAPSGRTLQVWGLAPGDRAPTSLAVLPHEPGKVVTIASPRITPAPGMLIEISVEPEGGSPTGRPTGPVVFIGRLTLAGPDS